MNLPARRVLVAVCLLAVAATAGAQDRPRNRRPRPQPAAEGLPTTPQWIWLAKPADNQAAYFRREFRLSQTPTSIRVFATGDDQVSVSIDGQPVFDHDNFNSVVMRDVTRFLSTPENPTGLGRHVIALQGKNSTGPAAVIARIVIETPDSVYVLSTGPSWKVSDKPAEGWQKVEFNDSKWAAATPVGKLGDKPWNTAEEAFASAAELREPTATPIDQLKVAKGFKVELLHSVPKPREGSWVNLCADPRGRLIVSDQYGGLYRVTVPLAGTELKGPVEESVKVEPIAVDIGEAQGLVWAFDSLYVVVNKGQKYDSGLYRVRDTNGDDQLDKLETLRKIDGGGEHGPHAVVPSPDGKSLFIVCGNATKMMDYSKTRVPPFWGEDHLLPRMPDGKGFMKDVMGPGGCIYRVDPDGKEWELYSTGFRNEFDAAFNKAGDLFTYDADMEWDLNTPWYRPTRVCLAASGAEFGWRNGAGKWPAYYADSLPGVVNVGPGSPTGICFGYGAKFPRKYQDALFICDWSYGKLYATHMKPQGAGYTGELEEFVTGTPLPLTDVIVNPVDGAMYFTIGGRKVQSGLYRVTYIGPADGTPGDAPVASTPEREARLKLEQLHEKKDAAAVDQLWPFLGHEDRYLRFAARVALEHQDVMLWRERALKEQNPHSAITALLALTRVSGVCPFHLRKDEKHNPDAELRSKIVSALLELKWDSLNYIQKLELVRVYHVLFNRFGPPGDDQREQLLSRFDGLYPLQGRELNIETANLLVYLNSPTVGAKTVKLLEAAPTQEEQIDYARALRVLKAGWTPELRKTYFAWFLKAYNYRGGASFALSVEGIKKDAVKTLSDEEKLALKEILEAKPEAVPMTAGPPRPFVRKWTVDELAPVLETRLTGRDFDRGRTLFGQANCFACHRFDNEGGANGPDLSGLAGRFSRRDLLESVIDPSKVISDQYGAVIIETLEGKIYTGRIINLSADTLFVNTNMLNPDEQAKIDRRTIVETQISKVSMMPAGLLDTFQEDEILDLMAYLLSRGDRNSAMFKK